MKKKIIFVLGSLILIVSQSWSEVALDVEVLIEEALRVNPEIKAAHEKWNAARQKAIQEGVLEDPMLGVEFEGFSTDTVDLGRYMDIEWSLSQSIPFPGKLSLKKKIALEEAEKAYLEYWEKKREIIRDVKEAYAHFYLTHRRVEVLGEAKQLLEQFSSIAQAKYAALKGTQDDVLKAQVELAKIRNKVLIEEKMEEAARSKINMLLARSPDETLEEPAHLEGSLSDFELEKLLTMALEHRLELKRQQAEVKANEFRLRLARRGYLPDFFTKLEARQFQGEGLEEYDVMFGVNLPWLWGLGRTAASVREAKANLEAARADYEAAKWMIFFEIKEALVKVKTARSLVELYRSSILPKAEQMVEVARAAYEANAVDFLTLLDSQRNLLEFELEYEEALSAYHQNLAGLERNVGKELEEISKIKN